jgi:hypothetical protein
MHTYASTHLSNHPYHSPLSSLNFFSLPAEIRIYIYELVFSSLTFRPIHLRHHHSLGWLASRPYKPRWSYEKWSPSTLHLLQLNRQIYHEAIDVLNKLCDGGSTMIITEDETYSYQRDWWAVEIANGRDWTRVREVLPTIVLGVREKLTLKVAVSSCYEKQAKTIALCRWIRAVVNSNQSEERRPKKLHVRYEGDYAALKPGPESGLYAAFQGWRCEDVHGTFSLMRYETDSRERVPVEGEEQVIKGLGIIRWGPGFDSEEAAWRECEKASKLVKEQEKRTVYTAWLKWWFLRS